MTGVFYVLYHLSTVPAKPAVPVARGTTTSSVNVTFEYGLGGGYPLEFIVKYREKGKLELFYV